MNTHELDLQDAVEKAQKDIEEIAEKAEDTERDSNEYEELETEYKAKKVRENKFKEAIEELGGSVFVVKELTFGELMRARDEVISESFETNRAGEIDGVPREGHYKLVVLDLAIVDGPANAPDDAKGLPYIVGEWMFEQVDDINTGVTEESVENLSLQDEM